MCFRAQAAAILLAALAAPVAAQVEEGGLEAVDPFGRGYLDAGETAMPTDQWKASRTGDLLPLMRAVRTRDLSPAERILLRRVVLSPAARPDGEEAEQVLAERARILYELGEASAAADLLGRLQENPIGLDAEALSADLQLALGNERSACAEVTGSFREGVYWAKLRTVCAVLGGDTPAAELAVELAQAQGVEDDWFFDAVFAASLETDGGPEARYESGLYLALSTAADLPPPEDAVAAARPDLAAAMAARDTLPIELRVQAAGVAAETGTIEAGAHRALYSDLLAQEGFEPNRTIEVAVFALEDAETEPTEQARKLAMALRAALGKPARFAAASRLFAADLEALERSHETARHALLFARAAIAADNPSLAIEWSRTAVMPPPEPEADEAAEGSRAGADSAEDEARVETADAADPVETPAAPEVDPFEHAFVDGLILLAGGDADPEARADVASRLAEHSEAPHQRARAVQLLSMCAALDIAPPADARALIAAEAEREGARRTDAWTMVAIRAAAEADAAGEAVLKTLTLTEGDPSGLHPADLIAIIDALRAIGAEDLARPLALEATGYWKPLAE